MKKIILIISTTFLFTAPILAQVCFTSVNKIYMGTFYNARNITSADFNGDGNMDIAISNYAAPGNVKVLLGNGTGSFAAAVNYSVASQALGDITNADFNGDGKLDLVTSGSLGGSFLAGNGTGSFVAAVSNTTGIYGASLKSADFNGDGKMDIATVNGGTDDVSVFFGNGTGSFSTPVNFSVGIQPETLVNADFNNDGKSDLVTANYINSDLSVLLGTGTGSFAAAVNYTTPSTQMHSVTSADFNGDGNMDLVGGDFQLLLGNGTGSFATPISLFTGTTRRIISADFNGDGKMDLALSDGSQVGLIAGNGSGSFAVMCYPPTGSGFPYNLISADFNNDGKLDLAVGNDGPYVDVYLNDLSIGINEVNRGNYLVNLFPNPATEHLNIANGSNIKINNIVVLDIIGRKVLEQKENTSQINIQSLEQGMYQLQITSEGKNYSSKFIKE